MGDDEGNDSWLSKIFNSILNIPNSIVQGLAVPINVIKGLLDNIFNLLDVLNPFSENFILKLLFEELGEFLKGLFVPSLDCFSELYEKFNLKFGFVSDIKEVFDELFSYSDYGKEEYPTFSITYAGITTNIIDFSAFDNYRQFFHTIVIFVCWIPFLLRQYKKIPNFINGMNGGVD